MADSKDAFVFAALVRAEFQGYGIGRQLMKKAEAFLFELHPSIWLDTDGSSRAAGFYEKLGWVRTQAKANGNVRFEKHRGSTGG